MRVVPALLLLLAQSASRAIALSSSLAGSEWARDVVGSGCGGEGVGVPPSDSSAQLLSGDRARVKSGSPSVPPTEADSGSLDASLSASDPPAADESEYGLSDPTPLALASWRLAVVPEGGC